MSYHLRTYRHRNPKGGDEKKTPNTFFKELPGVQRLATSKEDEKLGTNDARMEKDKEEPMKPVQKKDNGEDKKKKKKKPEQGKGGAAVKKKKKTLQRNAEEKAPEKEKPHKDAVDPEKDKKKKTVQKKEDTAAPKVADEIKNQTGKGSPLPPKVLAEMNKSFGVDFSGVRIHTDASAAKLCRQLNALAFTHGQDIFFNEGRFNPESKEGKILLAHELTHVVQQANSTES